MSFLQEYKIAYKNLRTGRIDASLIKKSSVDRESEAFIPYPNLTLRKKKNVDCFNPIKASIHAFGLVFVMRKSRNLVNVIIENYRNPPPEWELEEEEDLPIKEVQDAQA